MVSRILSSSTVGRTFLFIMESLQCAINTYILTTKQLILYRNCKEKIDVNKQAGAERLRLLFIVITNSNTCVFCKFCFFKINQILSAKDDSKLKLNIFFISTKVFLFS